MAVDPVAAKSSFLCMYMSNHPDTLVSYVRYWGKVKEKVLSAQMASIDSKGMTLKYTAKVAGSGEVQKEARITFDPPLSGYDEVKGRLMQMKADAEESLGMTKAPQISDFDLGPNAWKVVIAALVLLYLTFAPRPGSSSYGPIFSIAAAINAALPNWTMRFIWTTVSIVHSLECLYTYSLCRKHRTPFFNTVLYLLATFALGYPVWVYFRKRVQAARIDSIMKGH